jgi:methionyl-tRNA formyltransferase
MVNKKDVMVISCNMEIQHFNFVKNFTERYSDDFEIFILFQSHLKNRTFLGNVVNFVKKQGFKELIKRVICRNGYSKIFADEQKEYYDKAYEYIDMSYFYKKVGKDNIIITDNINGRNIEDFLSLIQPKFFLLQGGKLLKSNILNVLKNSYKLHLHMGIVPFYRGGNSQFWAIYNNSLNENGFTIQSIDLGIDTGDIYIRKSVIDFDENDNQHTMFIKTHKEGIKAICSLIDFYKNNKYIPKPMPVKEKGFNYSGKMMTLCVYEYVFKNRDRIFKNYSNSNKKINKFKDLSVI